ncbi:MAG: hypothetical protein QMD44_13310 [Thermodesulfovibrionales bacterium]|nr:hypothetical protein [Thermodesulfovibrionales bacterium]
MLEWLYCPHCGEVTCMGLCGHAKEQQKFSGTLIRSILMDGVKPTRLIFRPEIFDIGLEIRLNHVTEYEVCRTN